MAAGNLVACRSGLNQKDRSNDGPAMSKEAIKEKIRHLNHHQILKELLAEYDEKGTGKLKRSEVRNLLVDQSGGREVSEDELDFVFKIADANGDKFISSLEMSTLLNCWENYAHSRKDIDHHFLKHDLENTGRLDREQLRNLLMEKSGWLAVSDEDLDYLMKQSRSMHEGQITKPELRRVLAMWDTTVHHRNKTHVSCCSVQ